MKDLLSLTTGGAVRLVPALGGKMSDLMPIGTEFWGEPEDVSFYNPPCQLKFLYRVIGHVKVARYGGDLEGELREQLEPIAKMERFPITFDHNFKPVEFTEWVEHKEGK